MDDYDLTAEYYRLRSRVIYLEHSAAARRLDPALIEMADLSRGIVHDLGNGLNVLRARLAAPPRRRGVRAAATQRAAETAGRLCDALGLRIYALPELSPDAPLRPSPVNLCEWLPDLLLTFRSWLGNSPDRPVVEFHTGVERLVVAEYDRRLRLAIWELLLNAQRAVTQPGADHRAVIRISLEKTPEGWAQIIVGDNGCGMPEGAAEALVEALLRSERAGVGLYLCHKIVEKHRGWLEIVPAPGGGTLARLTLPAGNPEPDWEDECELSRAMEALSDRARALEAEQNWAAGDPATDAPDWELLARRFGALSATTANHLEYGLGRLRAELAPLSHGHGHEAAALAGFALSKLGYLQAVVSNLRLFEENGAAQIAAVDMQALALQAASRMAWRSSSGRVRVQVRAAPGLPEAAGNPAWLAAALLNLLRNAIDAAADAHHSGAGRVWIQSALEDGRVCTRICDNGTGIPVQLQPRVFNFDYTSRSHRHYGLGLYLARRAIESAGGSLGFEVCVAGTKMVIKLIAISNQQPAASLRAEPIQTDGQRLTTIH